ncbi:DUF3237 domain-containing protein [Microbacterium halophytorum]|uniref:DUF3237 domain-containing protein n=1 Tax=Microbacterium halophytorum TaxID=2067568 RepID=UPI000CFAB6A7|nr:DUF3237 domain-containing protein [Microbacterium halophytorum]
MSDGADRTRPAAPPLEYFGTVTAFVASPVELGDIPGGAQRIIPIEGGTFDGPGVSGRILPGGADFQVLRSATTTVLEAKYAIETDQGERIAVENRGLRSGSAIDIAALVAGDAVPAERIYFRCVPRLTGGGRWEWLGDRIFVGTGTRHPDRVVVDVFLVA